MHVQVVDEQAAAPDLARAKYQAAEDPVMESSAFATVNPGNLEQMANGDGHGAGGVAQGNGRSNGATNTEEMVNAPITKSATDKIGRNEPCFCGSGKKFKLCHGRG
jgi:preprotein translocase subunit SecA